MGCDVVLSIPTMLPIKSYVVVVGCSVYGAFDWFFLYLLAAGHWLLVDPGPFATISGVIFGVCLVFLQYRKITLAINTYQTAMMKVQLDESLLGQAYFYYYDKKMSYLENQNLVGIVSELGAIKESMDSTYYTIDFFQLWSYCDQWLPGYGGKFIYLLLMVCFMMVSVGILSHGYFFVSGLPLWWFRQMRTPLEKVFVSAMACFFMLVLLFGGLTIYYTFIYYTFLGL